MSAWYAVLCKPRREEVAEANLRRQGYRVCLPRLATQRRRNGKWIDAVEPLFPRYLFVAAANERQNLAPVRSTVGVSNIVRFGAEYATVPDQIVQGLIGRADPQTGLHRLRQPLFVRGAHVGVSGGPLDGLDGVFERYEGEDRVLILLEFLGHETRVRIPIDRVVPVLAS